MITTVAADLADVFLDGAQPDPGRYSCEEAGSNAIDTEFMQ